MHICTKYDDYSCYINLHVIVNKLVNLITNADEDTNADNDANAHANSNTYLDYDNWDIALILLRSVVLLQFCLTL